jgi:hypothetical protein
MQHVSFSSVRLQWLGVKEEMEVERLTVLVKEHEEIYDALRYKHRNRVLVWYDDADNNKNNSTTNNIKKGLIVIKPSV